MSLKFCSRSLVKSLHAGRALEILQVVLHVYDDPSEINVLHSGRSEM